MNWKTILVIALSFFIVGSVSAKDKKKKITISGYVIDGNDQPLDGVFIFVDGQKLQNVTNNKGFYKIRVMSDIKTLMVYSSLNGWLEIEFAGQRKVHFILDPNSVQGSKSFSDNEVELLDDGYGLVRKRHSTSSAVKVESLREAYTYSSIYDMLQGVSGVSVINGRITIRGISSINYQAQPLFVVDGVVTSSIEAINPVDVKSITVLKGSEASIYGSRGAMGVIVITSKSGMNK